MKEIHCRNYNIIINDWNTFNNCILSSNPSSIFILVDENTEKFCLHQLTEKISFSFTVIKITSGEQHKTMATCIEVWSKLLKNGADRNSLLINLGGGVIGDLGGFCAATYMRGIRFIQMPTTLLSQVDASVGGKLGVDLMGYKNMIGLFQEPLAVFIFTEYLPTLPAEQLLSGYAEILKHGLISDRQSWQFLSNHNPADCLDYELLVYNSVQIKKNITEQDPLEKGMRKILNFGHTIGHALETYWLNTKEPLLHGQAIAIGIICEAFLSYQTDKILEHDLFEIRRSVLNLFGHHPKYVKPVSDLIQLMRGDKKNLSGSIRFALLQSIGHACYDVQISDGSIEESLLFYKEKM